MAYTNAQLKEMFKKLPQKVREAIFAEETANTMQAIGNQFALHIDQVGIVADEAGLVMLGVTPRSQFAPMIQKRARLTPEVASKISSEVETRVFKPIQEHLRGESVIDDTIETLPSPEQRTALTPTEKPYTPPPAANAVPQAPKPLSPPTPPAIPISREPMTIPQQPEVGALKSDASPFLPPPDTTPKPPQAPAPVDTGIVGSKLGKVTYGAPETTTQEPKKVAEAPSFTADPYREPIN